MRTTLAALSVLAGLAGTTHGATIANDTFGGGSPNSSDGELNSTASIFDSPHPNAGTDWGYSSGGNNVFFKSSATTNSELGALPDDFFRFTVTPNLGYEFDLTSLNFNALHNATAGGASDPGGNMNFFVRSSVDGFSSNIGSTFAQDWNTNTSRSVSLTGASFQDLNTATEFRVYIYDDGNNDAAEGARLDNVQLIGDVVPRLTTPDTSFQEGVSPTPSYTQDAVYINEGDPTGNGNNDLDQELIVGYTGSSQWRGLLEFDISAIPATDQIDSVSLVMRTDSDQPGTGGDITINLYEYGSDFDEASVSWNSHDSTLGTLLSTATFDANTQGLEVVFGDTEIFRQALADARAGDGFLRLLLARSTSAGSGNRFARFDDETVSPLSSRPHLLVAHSAIPISEPSTAGLALLCLGCCGLAFRRKLRGGS